VDPILVRRLGVEDAVAYRRLRLEGLRTDPDAFGGSLEEEKDRPDSFYVERFTGPWAGDDNFVFGAFDGGTLIATAGLSRRSGLKLQHKAILWGMYVAPGSRSRGAGRTLLLELLAFARTMPALHAVDLTVATGNAAAIGLYRSLGFAIWGTEPAALRADGRDLDEHHMSLTLR
jgi:ribosomal protein S18 acetylase RimI-like enzyme